MKCDDFPSLYESDDADERRLAEEHAAGCADCREMLGIIGLVREELSPTTVPAEEQTPIRPAPLAGAASPPPARFAVAATAVCVALAAAFLFVGDRGSRSQNERNVRPGVPQRPQIVRLERVEQRLDQVEPHIARVAQGESLRELDELEVELDRLSQRLDRISQRAALLQERNELAQLSKLSQ